MNLPTPPRGHAWSAHQNFNTGYARVALIRKGWRKWLRGEGPVDELTINRGRWVSVTTSDDDVRSMAWTILGHYANRWKDVA